MAKLKWRESYEIGVDFIDKDHKSLLNIINNIKKEIETGGFSTGSMLIDNFIKEIKAHFSREEAFLYEINYPGLEIHKAYHKELLDKTEKTKDILETMESKEEFRECFDGMSRFVFDDILQGDINFKSYLEHEEYTDNK